MCAVDFLRISESYFNLSNVGNPIKHRGFLDVKIALLTFEIAQSIERLAEIQQASVLGYNLP